MKFSRYLEESQAPEWKRAYIDFKGLKNRISIIHNAKRASVSESFIPTLPSVPNNHYTSPWKNKSWRRSRVLPIPGDRLATCHEDIAFQSAHNSQPPLKQDIYPSSLTGEESSGYTSRFIERDRTNKAPKRLSDGKMTVESMYATLGPIELSFFNHLDHELRKVDQFYTDQEIAVIARLSELKEQLQELFHHSRAFHLHAKHQKGSQNQPHDHRKMGDGLRVIDKLSRWDSRPDMNYPQNPEESFLSMTGSGRLASAKDPAEYQDVRRRLKKALREFYQNLELLNNYRVLNLTAFRKALKKYENVTKHSVQDLYTEEKIHPCRFAASLTMEKTMRDIENIYATRFANGDLKLAKKKLKSPVQTASHYSSMFRSGVYMGLAIPALIFGVYNSYQPHVRKMIPEWAPLLEIYFALIFLAVFIILIGVNILGWTHARINFPFIFELDISTAIDAREYFELPTLLLTLLCSAVWLSFFLVGADYIAPTSWPLIWLIIALTLLLNPLPIFWRASRFWLIRHISRLFIAGTHPVGFMDFWLGDQLCSLSFSLAHLYNIGCAYSTQWNNVVDQCDSFQHWAGLAILALPFASRTMQSLRRYYDSRSPLHLVNGGKYVSSIIMFATYSIWRSGGSTYDGTFVTWVVFATINSIYTSLWDLFMDWSILQPRRLLRPELIYSNDSFIYYFAMFTNVIIRFIWVIYIPSGGLDLRVRSGIVAGLEILRRFQWNFYRLENEQIGNIDQYRSTKEVPMPYFSINVDDKDVDNSDADDHAEYGNGVAGAHKINVPSFIAKALVSDDSLSVMKRA